MCVSVFSVRRDKNLLCCSPKGPISRPAAVGLYTLMTAYQLHTHYYTHAPTPTYRLQYAEVCGRAHVQTYRR